MTPPESHKPAAADRALIGATRFYERCLQLLFALVPALAIAYLHVYQFPDLCETHHGFHELAIGLAILTSGFVSYVTWRSYLYSGEPFLRWLTLGFLGFTLIYAPHGLLTRLAADELWLFIIYGPASRLVMLLCLVIGLLRYGQAADTPEARPRGWWPWIGAFLVLDLLLALANGTWLSQGSTLRVGMEVGALALGVLGVGVILMRRIKAPLIQAYGISLLIFAQSSLAFLLSKPWNHQWWLAHTIFAGGFFFLSYWVIQAFHSTRAFSTVFSQEEIMAQLREAKEHAERLASTDSLTGAANRRAFWQRSEAELARAGRSSQGVVLLLLDLDHFKEINDRHGHQRGDAVLQGVVRVVQEILRPSDLIGRIGGEEFLVLLPGSNREDGARVAERIRQQVEALKVPGAVGPIPVSASLGLAAYPGDGDAMEPLFKVADQRLYEAKRLGRNRVVG